MSDDKTRSLIARAYEAFANYLMGLARAVNLRSQAANRTNAARSSRDDAAAELAAYEAKPRRDRDPSEHAKLTASLARAESAFGAARMTETTASVRETPRPEPLAGSGRKKDDAGWTAALEKMFALPTAHPKKPKDRLGEYHVAAEPGERGLAAYRIENQADTGERPGRSPRLSPEEADEPGKGG